MTNQTLHRELVSRHNTIVCNGKYGRLSVRKTCGVFRVRLERYDTQNVNYADFKTLKGAQLYMDAAQAGLI